MSDEKLPALPSLGKAAEKMSDTVRHVVDLFAGPERTRAIAQAKADAAMTAARTDAEIEELKARTRARLVDTEVARQQNIEAITRKATLALPPPDQVSDEPVDKDWTTRFFEESKDISNEQMQEMWAKVLAREVAKPSSFSPRALTVLKDLTPQEAQLFEAVCSFVWLIPPDTFRPVIRDIRADICAARGLNYTTAQKLDDAGLINFHSVAGVQTSKPIQRAVVFYAGQPFDLTSNEPRHIQWGSVTFTEVGAQLLHVVQAKAHQTILDATIAAWTTDGWTVKPLAPAQP